MDLRTLRAFEAEVRRVCPEFKLGYKDQTFSQKLLGFLLPLKQTFLTKSATTVYPTIYFPSKKEYDAHPWSSFIVLAHELVHLLDTKDKPIARLSYLMPQVLAVFPLAAYVFYMKDHSWPLAIVLGSYLLACIVGRKFLAAFYVVALGGAIAAGVFAVLVTHWWSALLFGGLALLAPWPSPWRTDIEMRGYSMNVAITHWALGRVPAIYRTGVSYHFTGSSHYYTDWSGVDTRKRLDAVAERAQSGELQKEQPFAVVYSFMRRHKLLHHAP